MIGARTPEQSYRENGEEGKNEKVRRFFWLLRTKLIILSRVLRNIGPAFRKLIKSQT